MNCSAIFKTNPTDRGMCCTFNALAAEEIYRWSFLSWIILLCDKNQWKAFRKSQFSESVANLQKENVRDSFEAPPELPEGWDAVNSNFQFVFRFKYFLGPSFIDSIVLFLTGGVNQGMNQDLKLVSSLPECFQGFNRHCKYTMPLKGSFSNNIPSGGKINCTFAVIADDSILYLIWYH